MTEIFRNYRAKDVEMLTASATIVEQAIKNKTALVAKRPTWADPFFPTLKARIENAFSQYLGIDNSKQLREATIVIMQLQQKALKQIAEFKIQITEDFKTNKTRRNEILTQLGITAHLESSRNGSQESLVNLLYQYKTNMTDALKTEITTAGTSSSAITAIIEHADNLKNYDITQETLKGTRKTITQAAIIEFNAIYSQVISIARISSKLFADNKAIKDQFSFAKTLKALSHPNPKPNQPNTDQQPKPKK